MIKEMDKENACIIMEILMKVYKSEIDFIIIMILNLIIKYKVNGRMRKEMVMGNKNIKTEIIMKVYYSKIKIYVSYFLN